MLIRLPSNVRDCRISQMFCSCRINFQLFPYSHIVTVYWWIWRKEYLAIGFDKLLIPNIRHFFSLPDNQLLKSTFLQCCFVRIIFMAKKYYKAGLLYWFYLFTQQLITKAAVKYCWTVFCSATHKHAIYFYSRRDLGKSRRLGNNWFVVCPMTHRHCDF